MTMPPAGAVDKLLSYVDRPWKIAAVVILATTAIICLILYEQRATIAEGVLEHWVSPQLHAERFSKAAARLMSETGADLVVLAGASTHTNLIKNVDGLRRGDPGWLPFANPRPLYTTIRDPVRFVAFLEGRSICHDVDPQDGDEERAEAALGITRRCYVGVPPVLDALVGILAVCWRTPPSAEAEAGATKLLEQAATGLASW